MKRIIIFVFLVSLWCGVAQAQILSYDELTTSSQDIYSGSRGDAVATLQTFLSDEQYNNKTTYPERLVTGYFGQLTKKAVIRFQKEQGITPAYGYVGIKTKLAIKNKILEKNVATSQPPSVTPTVVQTPKTTLTVSSSPSVSVNNPTQTLAQEITAIAKNVMVSKDDIAGMLIVNGIPATIPAALEDALKNGLTDQTKKTLSVWKKISVQAQAQLGTASITHNQKKDLINWAQYNVSFVDAVLSGDGTPATLEQKSNEYKNTYAAQSDVIKKALKLTAQKPSGFWHTVATLIGMATPTYATPGLIPFGGVISITDTCLTGLALTISPPTGGAFFLYWVVYLYNPFLYKMVITGNWILGEAVGGPGICTHSLYDYYSWGQGMISYFGTGLQ